VVDAVRERTTVTASVGVCHALAGAPFDEALLHADQALYAAKDAGRDRARLHARG
jgi:PleD family two-component response regulator